MLIRCVFPFVDSEANASREIGDSWEVSEERFKAINATVYGVLVEAVNEEPAEKPKAKSKSKKAE